MDALPFDAVYTPPALALAVTLAWAWVGPPLCAWLTPEMGSRSQRLAFAFGLFALGCTTGFDALGPTLVSSPMPLYGAAIGLLGAALGVYRLRLHTSGKNAPLSAAAVAFIVAAAPSLLWVTARHATEVDNGASASGPRASWHRRLAPWDDQALLALAWQAQRNEEYDRAEALRELSVRAGVPAAQAEELSAEILASRGECEAARAAFDRALAARAEAALETFDLRLTDAYRLPETFVRRCGLIEEEEDSDGVPSQ